jgi:hypothetical protein
MGDYEMMMSEGEDVMDRVWLADRDRAIRAEVDKAIADTINEYEEFDGENRMDQPGFWYGQPDVNDEECD